MTKFERFILYLIGFRKILASHFDRSPLNHSFGYALAGDHPNCFTSISLKSDPFIQHAG
jgi:hypothetical protein